MASAEAEIRCQAKFMILAKYVTMRAHVGAKFMTLAKFMT